MTGTPGLRTYTWSGYQATTLGTLARYDAHAHSVPLGCVPELPRRAMAMTVCVVFLCHVCSQLVVKEEGGWVMSMECQTSAPMGELFIVLCQVRLGGLHMHQSGQCMAKALQLSGRRG